MQLRARAAREARRRSGAAQWSWSCIYIMVVEAFALDALPDDAGGLQVLHVMNDGEPAHQSQAAYAWSIVILPDVAVIAWADPAVVGRGTVGGDDSVRDRPCQSQRIRARNRPCAYGTRAASGS
jgi:hypothetical protein